MSSATSNWIINLTQKKPVLGLVAALLVGISTTSSVIVYKDFQHRSDIKAKDVEIKALNARIENKDSLYLVKVSQIQETSNKKIEEFMAGVIRDQKEQLRRQEEIERQRQGIYYSNSKIISKSHTIINSLENVQK